MNNPTNRTQDPGQQPTSTTTIQTAGGPAIGGNVESQNFIGRDLNVFQYSGSDQAVQEGRQQSRDQCRATYLEWIIARYRYLDPRGTFQTQRQVQLELDQVYIGLRAQADETNSRTDRKPMDAEMAELDRQLVTAEFSAEEVEDRRDMLHHRWEEQRERALPQHQSPIPLAQATAQHRQLVILGDPGSGKTTLLRYLVLQHAQAMDAELPHVQLDHDPTAQKSQWHTQPTRFPILIRIADYAEGDRWQAMNLNQFLSHHFTD